MPDPIAKVGVPDIDWPGLYDDGEFLDLSLDTLAPMELIKTFEPTALDDLDWRANGIAYGWHEGEKLQQDIMALARAVPKLTAELRRLRGA